MKLLIIFLVCIIVISLNVNAMTSITTCAELQAMSNMGESYILNNNIDCTGIDFVAIGDNVLPGNMFRGIFDGNDKIIYNLNFTGVNCAIFNYTNRSFIHNVKIQNISLACTGSMSSISATSYASNFSNIKIDNIYMYSTSAIVSGGVIASINIPATQTISDVSYLRNISVTNINFSRPATAASGMGGIVGSMRGGNIKDSYTSGYMDNPSATSGGTSAGISGTISFNYNVIDSVYSNISYNTKDYGEVGIGGPMTTSTGCYLNISNSFTVSNATFTAASGLYYIGMITSRATGCVLNMQNLTYKNNSRGTVNCVGFSASVYNNNCTVIQENNMNYFIDYSNPLYDMFDFNVWNIGNDGVALPKLLFESNFIDTIIPLTPVASSSFKILYSNDGDVSLDFPPPEKYVTLIGNQNISGTKEFENVIVHNLTIQNVSSYNVTGGINASDDIFSTDFCIYDDGCLSDAYQTCADVDFSCYSENDPIAYKTCEAITDDCNYLTNSDLSNIARIGTCPSGKVVQNTTTSGVQCVDIVQNSTTYYINATSITGGTITSTKLNDSYWYDGITYNITEGNGANPLTLYMNYTNVTSFEQWILSEYYLGSASHNLQFEIWDYDTSTWESYYSVVGQTGQTWIVIPVYDSASHIGTGANLGKVQTRINHIETGISSHRLYIDVAWLLQGNNIGASTNLNGYAKYSFGYNNFNGNGNMTTNYFIGNGSLLTSVPSTDNKTFNQTLTNSLYVKKASDTMQGTLNMPTNTPIYFDVNSYIQADPSTLTIFTGGNMNIYALSQISMSSTYGGLWFNIMNDNSFIIYDYDDDSGIFQVSQTEIYSETIKSYYDNTYDLGIDGNRWRKVIATNISTNNITISEIVRLKVITLPSCNSANNGTIGRNNTKIYFCDGLTWNGLY